MKPFNLKEAKAGKPVCTRDGKPVHILKYDARGEFQLLGYVEDTNYRNEPCDDVNSWHKDGSLYLDRENDIDLMMVGEKKEGWVNIIHAQNEGYTTVEDYIYNSEEDAKRVDYGDFEKIATIKIEWEE